MNNLPELISKKEICEYMGKRAYYRAVYRGYLKPFQFGGKTSEVFIEKSEFDKYMEYLKSSYSLTNKQ
jgi:hypothetical protein